MNNLADESTVHLKKDQVLCVEGERNFDLYLIQSGQLMICLSKGSQITPVAILGPDEFLGELSFFDQRPRSANVIALETCSLVKIPLSETHHYFPRWLLKLARFMTSRIRINDELIRGKGIKKASTNVNMVKPLSMQEQGYYFKILKAYRDANGIST